MSGKPDPADRLEDALNVLSRFLFNADKRLDTHPSAYFSHHEIDELRAAYERLRAAGSPPGGEEEDSCEDERMRLAIYDREGLAAAKAIKESDHWADNHWPAPVERLWYIAAQEEIARLRSPTNLLRSLAARFVSDYDFGTVREWRVQAEEFREALRAAHGGRNG